MLFRHRYCSHTVRPKTLKLNNAGTHPLVEWWMARILVELDVWERLDRDFFEEYDNHLSYRALSVCMKDIRISLRGQKS